MAFPSNFGVGPPRSAGQIGARIGRATKTAFQHHQAARPQNPSAPVSGPPPEASPFDAAYQANQAALLHQYENAQALYGTGQGEALGSARAQARANNTFALQGLGRGLTSNVVATRNRANTEGLAESGQLAQREGTVEAKFAAQRAAQGQRLQGEEGRFSQLLGNAREARERGEASDLEKAEARSQQSALRSEATTPEPQAPAGPPRVIAQTAQRRTAARRAARRR